MLTIRCQRKTEIRHLIQPFIVQVGKGEIFSSTSLTFVIKTSKSNCHMRCVMGCAFIGIIQFFMNCLPTMVLVYLKYEVTFGLKYASSVLNTKVADRTTQMPDN